MELKEIKERQEARRRVRAIDAAYVAANADHVVAIDVGGDQLMRDIDALLAEIERLQDERIVARLIVEERQKMAEERQDALELRIGELERRTGLTFRMIPTNQGD